MSALNEVCRSLRALRRHCQELTGNMTFFDAMLPRRDENVADDIEQVA